MVSQPYDVTNLTSEDFASEQYQAINLHNFEQLEQIQALPDDVVYNINVVAGCCRSSRIGMWSIT